MVDIYASEFPFHCQNKELFPVARKEAVEGCTHLQTKQQKYYVWKLLEYGLKASLGCNIRDAGLTPSPVGGWQCQVCKISLSHSKNAVAVAISDTEVGLDIESAERSFISGLSGKILTAMELEEYEKLPSERQHDFMLKMWTQKEALFKKSNQKVFSPSKIQTADKNVFSKYISIGTDTYMLSVATGESDFTILMPDFNL